MNDKFIPTHWLRIGKGKGRTYWRVRLSQPLGKGKEDGLVYYNAILSPRNTSGLHMVVKVPETHLREIKKRG